MKPHSNAHHLHFLLLRHRHVPDPWIPMVVLQTGGSFLRRGSHPPGYLVSVPRPTHSDVQRVRGRSSSCLLLTLVAEQALPRVEENASVAAEKVPVHVPTCQFRIYVVVPNASTAALAENGLQDPLLSMRAFKSNVLPTLSYGAEIWAPQLILQGRTACERVQLEYLRGLLGVRDSTPALTVLAETGHLPLPAYWTLQVARFVSNLQAMGGERVARLAMLDSVALAADTDTGLPLARQPWAAQVSRVLAAAGAPCDLTADEGVAIPELAEALLERHVASFTHASVKVQRYIEDVWGGSISAEAYTPASFLCDVPERRRRVRLAQWRTGSHW